MKNYTEISSSIEKRIRETRKKDIIQKISDLNNKLSPPKETYITPQKDLYNSSSVSDFSRPEANLNSMSRYSGKANNSDLSHQFGNYQATMGPYGKLENSEDLMNFRMNARPNLDQPLKSNESYINKETESKIRENELKQKQLRDAIERSKREHNAKMEHMQQELGALKKGLASEQEQYDKDTQSLKMIISSEGEKFNYLNSEHKKLREAYQSQVGELKGAVVKMRGDYEGKLQDFEKLLNDSNKTIAAMRDVMKKEEEQSHRLEKQDTENEDLDKLERALVEKNKALENIEKDFHEIKISYKKKLEAFINVIQSKDEIIEELTKSTELREEEIGKIEEYIKTFKLLFEKYNEEKKYIQLEKEKLNLELEQYKQLILMGQNILERNGQLNGDENEEEGSFHGDEDQNEDMNDRNEEEVPEGGEEEDEEGLAVAS